MMKKYVKIYLFVGLIIAFDQAVKLGVHFNMDYGELGEILVLGDWFKLHYTLNPGMAFGMEINQTYGKLFLSLFRLVAVGGIIWYLSRLIFKQFHRGFILSIALILAGALGNLMDSIFYGVWLDNAVFLAETPILYPWFHGQVIDMFYFDIWEGELPEFIPAFGGQFVSLLPIFNIADVAIFIGILLILVFQKQFLPS